MFELIKRWRKRRQENRELREAYRNNDIFFVNCFTGILGNKCIPKYDPSYSENLCYAVPTIYAKPENKSKIRMDLYRIFDGVEGFDKINVIITPQINDIYYAYIQGLAAIAQNAGLRADTNPKDTYKWTVNFDPQWVEDEEGKKKYIANDKCYDFKTQMCFDITDYIYDCIMSAGRVSFRIDILIDDSLLRDTLI